MKNTSGNPTNLASLTSECSEQQFPLGATHVVSVAFVCHKELIKIGGLYLYSFTKNERTASEVGLNSLNKFPQLMQKK